MSISFTTANPKPTQAGDRSAAEKKPSLSQIKMEEISEFVQTKFALSREMKEILPLDYEVKKVEISSQLKQLLLKIHTEGCFYNDSFMQAIVNYALIKADKLNTMLISYGVKTCQLKAVVHDLYIHMGLWYYATSNEEPEISSKHANTFYFSPQQFNASNLFSLMGPLAFNPLEVDVKKHLIQTLIGSFVLAYPKPQISFDEFIKLEGVPQLVEDLVLASQALKEVIYHKNFHELCENKPGNYMNKEDLAVVKLKSLQSHAEKFKLELHSFEVFNQRLIGSSPYKPYEVNTNPDQSQTDNEQMNFPMRATHFYWFNQPVYHKILEEITKDNSDKQILANLFVEEYSHLLRFLVDNTADMYRAKKGLLSYKSWSQKTLGLTPPDDANSYKFRSQLAYLNSLMTYFAFSFAQLFMKFSNSQSVYFGIQSDRIVLTQRLVDFHQRSQTSSNLPVTHQLVKKFYVLLQEYFSKRNLGEIGQICLNVNAEQLDWFDLIKNFVIIEFECDAFREFTQKLMGCNLEIQKYLTTASVPQKALVEKEYDLVKSHFLIPVFILNSISKLEKQVHEIYVDKSEGKEVGQNESGQFFLDEINHLFIDEQCFRPPEVAAKSEETECPELAPQMPEPANSQPETEKNIVITVEIPKQVFKVEDSLVSQDTSRTEQTDGQELMLPAISNPEDVPQVQTSKPRVSMAHASSSSQTLPPVQVVASEGPVISFSRGIKVRKLIKNLQNLGFDLNHKTGSHAIFKLNKQQVVVPTSTATLPRGTLQNIEERVNQIVSTKKS